MSKGAIAVRLAPDPLPLVPTLRARHEEGSAKFGAREPDERAPQLAAPSDGHTSGLALALGGQNRGHVIMRVRILRMLGSRVGKTAQASGIQP